MTQYTDRGWFPEEGSMNGVTLAKLNIPSVEFLRAYLVTMRPYLLFVSGITGVAGMSFVEGMSPIRSTLVFAASFLSYGFGQALTDCFQTDTDALSSPYRPLVQGIVTKGQVAAVSIAGMTWCIAVFAVANPWNLVLGAIAGLGLMSYTTFKRKWWAGPFYNAWIVAVLLLMASGSGGSVKTPGATLAFLAMIVAVFFGYANFVLIGYFKDIEADRATGYNTLPVVWGRKAAAVVSDLFALIATAGTLVALIADPLHERTGVSLATILMLISAPLHAAVRAQVRLHAVTSDQGAYVAIVPAIHAYILLLSSIACVRKPEWGLPLILFYVLFTIVMHYRPERTQV